MMGWVQWCGLMIMVPVVWAGADLDIDIMVTMFSGAVLLTASSNPSSVQSVLRYANT